VSGFRQIHIESTGGLQRKSTACGEQYVVQVEDQPEMAVSFRVMNPRLPIFGP
jgi:hypothetical protein